MKLKEMLEMNGNFERKVIDIVSNKEIYVSLEDSYDTVTNRKYLNNDIRKFTIKNDTLYGYIDTGIYQQLDEYMFDVINHLRKTFIFAKDLHVGFVNLLNINDTFIYRDCEIIMYYKDCQKAIENTIIEKDKMTYELKYTSEGTLYIEFTYYNETI